MEFLGAAAVVSGGAQGLGGATVRRLVKAGVKVIIADLDETRGMALCAELGGGAAQFVKADVTNPEQVQAAVEAAQVLGPLRIAVSCAGIGWAQRTLNKEGQPHDLERFRHTITVNLIGTFNVLRLCAAAMARNAPNQDGERGVIINTASAAAFEGQIGQVAYAASKGGVVGMTLPAARDLAVAGIRVLTIAPGTFDTPMMATLSEAGRKALCENIPFPRRLGRPDEYAAMVQHIAENPYLNGEVIRLDAALRLPIK